MNNYMSPKYLENLIERLEIVQMKLQSQRRDHNGQVLQHDDIDQIQITIEIIKNLIVDKKYIWKNKTK